MGKVIGKVGGALFGKSSKGKSEAQSSNQAFPFLQDAFGDTTQYTSQAGNALSALLGIGGDTGAQDAAFQNYRDNTGYDFQMDEGTRAITGNNAAKGLLGSGSTLRRLTEFGQGLADTSTGNYLDRLQGLGDLGLQAGSVISGAGAQSTSNSSQKGGKKGLLGNVGKTIGTAAATIGASDRRLKKNIVKLRQMDNGLNVYQYDYINGRGPYIGVMADEVEKIMPEALGPVIDGYKTVDYTKIGVLV